MRIVDDGAAEGAEVAILQSTDLGSRLYESLGFRTVVEHDGFVDAASPDPDPVEDPRPWGGHRSALPEAVMRGRASRARPATPM